MNRDRCCECKEGLDDRSVLVCADCGGVFHYPDSRVDEPGDPCGRHEIGLRSILGWDVVPMCMRCDVAFRLRHGIPA